MNLAPLSNKLSGKGPTLTRTRAIAAAIGFAVMAIAMAGATPQVDLWLAAIVAWACWASSLISTINWARHDRLHRS